MIFPFSVRNVRRIRAKKPVDAPTRPKSAYMFFLGKFREKWKASDDTICLSMLEKSLCNVDTATFIYRCCKHCAQADNPDSKKVSEVAMAAGDVWRSLPQEQKAEYEIKSAESKVCFQICHFQSDVSPM